MTAFASDNYSSVHPDILNALSDVNSGYMGSYGNDPITEEVKELFTQHFGDSAQVYFLTTGTATNTLILKHITRSWNSVICSDMAHINSDECGAPQEIAGLKLAPIKTVNGKIDIESLPDAIIDLGDVHRSQPKVISITQSTELGSLYSLDEIKTICDFAHANGLLVHLDGARIANACVALNATLKEMTTDLGVDVVSFGGTKNGCMLAEAAVFLKPNLGDNFGFIRKQNMQLISKMRYVAAQFKAYFKNDLWVKNAENSNKMAAYLESQLGNIKGLEITAKVESNAVFAIIPRKSIEPLQNQFPFYVWDELTNEVRWMASWDTTKEQIDDFVTAIKKELAK